MINYIKYLIRLWLSNMEISSMTRKPQDFQKGGTMIVGEDGELFNTLSPGHGERVLNKEESKKYEDLVGKLKPGGFDDKTSIVIQLDGDVIYEKLSKEGER